MVGWSGERKGVCVCASLPKAPGPQPQGTESTPALQPNGCLTRAPGASRVPCPAGGSQGAVEGGGDGLQGARGAGQGGLQALYY